MNVQKIIALGAIAGTVVVVGYHAARAQSANACANQPNMAGALAALHEARASLDKAEHDKGGWRVKAAQATDTAIAETTRGCTFASTGH